MEEEAGMDITFLTLPLAGGYCRVPSVAHQYRRDRFTVFLYFRRFDARKFNALLPFNTEKHAAKNTK